MNAGEIRTEHLLLRPWRREDAAALRPVLEANVARLAPWIPAHVWQPAPVADLEQRLTAFAADFTEGRAWRFAIFALDDGQLCGEVDLFFRAESGRVPVAEADRSEIGYWLREDVTGRGYATEAARAMMELAARLPRARTIEIRCDPRNERSAAVPRRLGFQLAEQTEEDMIWVYPLEAESRQP